MDTVPLLGMLPGTTDPSAVTMILPVSTSASPAVTEDTSWYWDGIAPTVTSDRP